MNVLTEFLKPNPVWSYSCRHELGDWDRSVHLPRGFDVGRKNITVMNSNGIAADPLGVLYGFGGEIQTPVSLTCGGQVKYLNDIKALFPEVTVNHRSVMHVSVLVPEIATSPDKQERIAKFNHRYLHEVIRAFGLIHANMEGATIEFHHFPGTLDAHRLLAVVTWCKDWLRMALGELDVDPSEWIKESASSLPEIPEYFHWREKRFTKTVHDGTVSKTDIQSSIRHILAEGVPSV